MKKIINILLFLLLVTMLLTDKALSTISGSLDAAGYKALSEFIYDFQKFSEASYGGLCVYGSDDIVSSMIARYSDVTVLKDKDLRHIKNCRLVYIAEDQDRFLMSIMLEFNSQKITTISFLDDFLERDGTFYAQIDRGGKIKLHLNRRIKAIGIKINPLVLNLITND